MDKILVHGGRRLSGSIKISGSKNSSLPILAATLLTREPCVVHGVPDLSDTNYMLQILAHLGAQVERASGTVTVTAEKVHCVAPYDVVRKMRASVCVLGPLLGRCKEATVALPGGCVIGDRPIDLHLKGFEALGAAVRVEGGDIKVFAPKLHAARIDMQGKFGPTVLGTDNVMMAAALADGVTIIEGAACEPEVMDLANFLNKMGAKTLMSPPSTRTAEPKASKPFKCKSIGRSPMTQPPGKATLASLHRPSNGPRTQTDARIFRTTSYGATQWIFSAVTVTVPLARSTCAPR